ncbi:MAG: hypothetical protein WBD28_02650 [Candidatus Zixiibacteriota bacterium]
MSFRDMFSLDSTPRGEKRKLSPQQEEILDKIAKKVIYWKMSVPAILFLESVKPLNYIGSQMMAFFEPFVQTVFSWKDYEEFRKMMEERGTIELLLLRIEKFEAEAEKKEKEDKERLKEERKRKGKRNLWQILLGRE